MLRNKTVAVVVPAYNEEKQIAVVLKTMPVFVDRIIVVNDCSTDGTAEVVKEYVEQVRGGIEIARKPNDIQPTFFNRAEVIALEMEREEEQYYPGHTVYNDNNTDRIVLINNLENAKVGGAIAVGYKWCREHLIDCTAVMAGDAQMDPDELESICLPIVNGEVAYTKGNRLNHKAAKRIIPAKRRIGNSILSALTKIASGYWRVSDTQTGYTAISLEGLNRISICHIWRGYGMPNDMLIKLNIAKCRIKEVPIKPVYAVGEQSKMKIKKIIPTVSVLLLKGFFERIIKKYCVNDFHPIFVFYLTSLLSFISSLYFFVIIVRALVTDRLVTSGTYQGFGILVFVTLLMFGFAMWFDMYDNDNLQ
ncbi:MAG: glycosyltransferase family 2 protein [Candidatus Gastranaerophilales bacterium]|nr:glycosyltransferase family 2 protein [Candidatus Gastranaerophilales bacterium]